MAHPKYKFLIFVLMALATANSYAQYSVNMSNGQTLPIDGCLHPTGTIYDDGGPNGSYSNNFDGYVVITVPSGITINITGSYDLEGCCDYITIWDGDANGTQIWNNHSSGTLTLSATSGTMTIRFHSDYSVNPSGFALSYTCSGVGQNCINASTGVTVSNITTSSAQVDWNATNTSGPFMVNLNGNISTVNTNTLSLTGLNANTHYDLAISSVSDNWAPCCTARESFRTACGTMNPPMQESFDDYGIGYNIIPTCWTKLLNYDDTLNEPQIVGNPYSSSPGALRMYCGSNNDGNHYSMVIAPRMNVDDIATMSVRFSLRAAYSGTYIIVGVCDSTLRSNNNFTPVDTLTVDNINTWEEKLVPLASYIGSGKYIAFRMQRSLQSGDGRFIFIDDVALIPCGTWNERLYNRTSNSMWLSFDTIGSPVVNIEYGVAGFTSGTGTTLTGVTSPLRLTGLTPSTQYEVHIHSLCSGVPVEPRSVQWSTLEGPDNNITRCQDFETGSTLPPSWLRTGVYDGTPTTSTSYHHSGGRSLRVRPYYTNTMPIVALPLINTVSIQHLNVSFYLYSDGYTSGQIEVGIMEYPENATSFTPVDTVYCTASRSWQYKQVSLDRYSGTGSYIALRASDPNTPYNSMYIDDLNVGSCLAGGVHYTNVGSHSVEIRWDTVGTSFHGDSIIVEYGGTGFEEGTGTRLSVPVRGVNRQLAGGQQRLVVSGLAADSSYQFIVYGACDTIVQHCDAVRLSAHTLEQDILLPFCVDFEGMADGSFPSGWYRPSMYDNFPRIYDNGALQHSGSRALYLRSYRDLENHSTIVLPLLETDSMNGLVVDFFAYGNAGDGHTLQIGIMEDPNDENTFTAIATAAVGYHRWERHAVAINDYIGTGRHIAIRNRNNYYYSSEGVWIDDLVVSSADASGRTVSSVTSHGATFTWQPQGRSYNGAIVEWGPTGFTRGTGTSVTVDANTFSLTVDTLQTNTTYDCYITALSSETTATCNYGCNTFTTFEHPMVSSYCYSFEDTDPYGFPSGWTRPIVYDSRPRVENTAHTGSSSLYMRSYNCSGNNYTSMAAMPYLEETSLDGLTLTFYTRGYNYYSSSRLYIGMLTDPSSPSTFDTIAEINYDWSSNWHRHTVDLSSYSGNGRHIAFWLVTLNGCNEGNLYLDDITLSRCDITDVHIYSITAHDAWLTWGTNGSVDSVDVEYIGSTSSSPTIVTNASSPLHLAGLNADETYTCQVRAWCSGSAGSCSNDIYTFTTRTDSIAPGYCCDFGSYTPWQPPQYWTILQSYDNHPQVIETDGDRNLEFYTCSYEGTGNLIVMPAAENPVAGGVVSFSLRCTNSSVRNRARFTIGVITIPYDSSTFIPIRTIYPTYQWHRYSVDLSAYTGTARHIAFRYTSTDGCFYTLLDDLGFSLCRPGDLRATNITDQSCRLTWRRYGTTSNTTRYTVEYGPTGFTRGSGTLIHTTDTTVAITVLTNSTSYQFFVWSSCQDSNECQQEEVTVHTLDEPLYTPFCNNFDSETADHVPADWVRPYGDEYPRISTDRSHSSNKSIQFYSYCCNNWEDQTSMAAMPMVSTDNMSSLQVDFYYYNENPDAALVIGVMTNPRDTNTFTPLHTVRTSGHWARIKKSLSSYSGSGRYIAFRYRASYCSSGWAYIDDLTLRSCAITDCRLSGLGQDGVDVVWHATSSTPGVWMTYGHSASSQSAPTYHTSSPIHIAGLTEATPFEIHLWPQCDSTPDNCNYETLREETLHTWVNIPYCTNFDGIGPNSFPNNWRRLSTVSSDYPRTSSYIRHSEGNSMQFYAVDSLYSLAAMPTVNPSNGCMAVSGLYANFWTRFEGYSSSARLVVGVMTDILDTNSFVGVDTLTGNYSDWEHHTLSLAAHTGSGHIIAFKLLTADGNWCECYLDDLCIEKCVTSDLTITDITQTSITVSWTGHGTQGIIVEYGPRGFAHGHGTFDTLVTSPTTIDGLSELTEYEFNFKTLCDCQIIGATYLPGGGSPGTTSGGSWGGGGGTGGGGGGGGGWGGGTGIIITTQAHYLEIPYCESYETYDTLNFPPSYRRIVGSSNLYPVLTTTNHHSGEGCMALYTTTDTACFFSLPPLEEGTTTEMVMTFYAYAVNGYATSTDALQVGIMSNPDDASTYTPVAAFRLDNTARWQQFSVDFAPYIGTGQYITFRFKPIYASYIYYIDDIYVGRCGITNVQFTTSPTSVQVGWTALHSPTAVNIEYGRQGYDRADSTYSPTVVTATYSPCTITGIDPDSNYDFYIMAQCSDTDMALCAPVAYTLNPMLYPPYCQDFEDLPSGVIPDHWKVVRGRDPYPLTETQYSQQIMAFYPCTYNDNTVLLRPLPSGDSLGGKWVYADFSTSNNNYIYLDFGTLADTSDANTFVQMASISNGQTDMLQEFNVQLTGGSPALNRLAIRARSTSGCRWIRLARLALTNYPYPTGLNSTVYGSSSRRITWSGQYNNPYYTIEYGYGDNWRTVASDSCQALLSNLQPAQTYQVFFVSPDGERLCLPYTFTTPDAVPLPHCDNFDSYDDYSVPPGWYSYSAYGDNYPRTYSSNYRSCCRTMDFYTNNNHLQYTALPDFDIDSVKHLDLQFSLRIEDVSRMRLVVGVMDDRTDFNTFVPVDTLTCPSNSVHYPQHVSLAPYNGTGRFVAFLITTTGGRNALYLDDLVVSPCPLPDLTVSGARQVKAALPEGTPADYWMEYGPEGCIQGDSTNTLVHVTENPFYITGLQPNTTYNFFARCFEQVPTCAPPTTLTTSEEMSIPYCETFDTTPDYQMPAGWTRHNNSNSNYPRKNYDGIIQFYNNCNYNSSSYAVMPDVAVDSLRHLDLYFDLYSDRNQFLMIVGVMDDQNDINTFVPVDTVQNTATYTWQPMHASLHSYRGTGRFITFCMVNTTGNCSSMYIDDLRINDHPTPSVALTGATTATVLTDSVDYSPDYWIEYGPEGCTQGDSSNTWVHITSDSVAITGLEELTTYDFYHHTDSGDVTCFPPESITTSTVLPAPYCESFDSAPDYQMPTGWTRQNSYHADYPRKNYDGIIQFYNNCNNNSRSYAIMPDIDIDSLSHAEVHFSLYSDRNQFLMIVGVMSDQNDINTFVAVDTVQNTASYTWQPVHASLHSYRGTGRFITFCMVNTTGNCSSMYIDDLAILPCPQPNIQLVGATTVAATIDSHYTADYWLEYGPAGIVQGAMDTMWSSDGLTYSVFPANTLIHVTQNTAIISGLQENTTYDFYMRCDSAVVSDCYPYTQVTTSQLMEIPYCDDFADYGTGTAAFPTGWRRYMSDNNNSRLYVQYDGDAADGRDLRFEIYNALYAYAVLPELDIDSVRSLTLRVTMWSSYNPETMFLEVGVMTDMNDINTFTVVDTLRNYQNGRWEVLQARLANYTGHGRFIALRMRETNGSWRTIWVDRIEILTCDIPANAHASLSRHNEVRIDASEPSRTGFWVEYGIAGFEQGTGTFVHIDSLPTHLILANSTTYDFYFRCDTVSPTCIPLQQVTTQAGPIPVPLCMDFDTCQNNRMPYGWHNLRVPQEYGNDVYVYSDQSHSGSRSLRFCSAYTERTPLAVLPDLQVDSLSQLAVSFWMKNNNYGTFILDLGVMSDPYDASSFITLKRFTNTLNNTWQRMQAILTGAPAEARFLAFRLTKTSGSWDWLYLDDLYITTCGAADLQVAGMTADHITLDWKQTGQPDITVEYGPVGFADGTGTTLHPTAPPLTVSGLDNLTNYEFRYCASCDDNMGGFCNWNYCDTIMIFTPAGGTGCIDPTNLTAEYTTCTYGSYSNPRSRMGVVNYGNQSALSRHTVHYDTTERDPRTGGLLRTVPEGAVASVRLGNWTSNNSNPEAESVTYSLFVDPSSFDLLILKYAAVLQDPEHSAAQQPRFSIEILNEYNELIDSRCGAADFIANANLGWNEAANDVLWKDWTTVGLDMSAYANQTIRIRLTTYDCGEGSHYGYAYFTLDCLLKNIRAEYCGEVESNIFTMPDGFNYSWYTDTVERTTLYTTQSINIPTSNTTYYCDVSFVDNAECFFTMSAYAGTRYPLALFDSVITLNNCQFYVQFNNLSTISTDGVTPIGTGEGCESAFWDFGNGMTSTDYNGSTVYTTPGTYDVMLISYLGGGSCADTIIKTLTLEYPSASPSLAGPTDRCAGNLPDTVVALNGVLYQWITDDTTSTWTDSVVVVTPTADTVLRCIVTNADGCTDTLQHTILVHPVFDLSDTLTLCTSQLPFAWGDTTLAAGTQDGTYAVARQTAFGCDSSATLSLTVNDVSSGDTTAVACDQFAWHDSVYTASTTAFYTTTNAHGCDSTVTLYLTVRASSHSTGYDTVASSALPYSYHGHTLMGDTTVQVILTNAEGCDSTIDFHLTVIWQTYSTLYDTVCDSELPYTWNHRTFAEAGTQYDTLSNAAGADSLLTMVLHVLPSWHLDFYDTICSNQTASFGDSIYSTAGDYTHALLTTAGCDSLRTLHLAVLSTSTGDTSATACDQFTWHDSVYTASTTATHITTGAQGCDSTVTLHLTVNRSSASTYYDTCTENQLPRTFHSITAHGDTANAQTTVINAAGCDSVITYHLHVLWNNRTTVHDTVCDSELPYTWNHRTFAEAGTQYDTLSNAAGADSLLTMVLHVLPSWHLDFYDTICSNQSASFGDSTYSTAGDYTHALLTTAGCDSLRTLHLAVLSTSAGDTSATACDQFTWHDSLYTASTTASFITTGAQGCDSTVTLHLTVNRSSASTYYDTCTENQLPRTFHSITAHGDTANAQTTVINAAGCDSVITYHLHVLWNNRTTVHDTVCDSELPYTWNHRTFAEAGTQYDTLSNAAGADSLLTMVLHVLPTWHLDFYDTICSNQSASFGDSTYSTAGDYTHALLTTAGCDSLRTLHLAVLSTSTGDTSATACDQFTWHDSLYTASTTASFITTGAQGCDSTVTLHLTVNRSSASTYYDTCTENQLPHSFHSITAHGDTAGAQTVLVNAAGCDSMITYHLHVLWNNRTTVHDTVCDSQLPYTWNHRTFAEAGTQYDTLSNAAGADSLLTMVLHVLPTWHLDFFDTICSNQSASFGDSTYSTAGDYTHALLTTAGCDSLRTLHLAVLSTSAGDTSATACDQFMWHDSLYTASTTATHTTTNAHGCDSTVTLHLTVYPSVSFYDADTICQNQLANGYTWRDTVLYTAPDSGIYTRTRATVHGCDSTLTLALSVMPNTASTVFDTIVENQAATWQFNGIVVPTDTTGMLVTITNHWGCDSVINYNLHVWRNSHVTIDSSICDNLTSTFSWYDHPYADTLSHTFTDSHGADSVVTLLMHTLPSAQTTLYDTICQGTVYSFADTLVDQTGDYTASLLTAYGCDSVVTLHLVVLPSFQVDVYDTIRPGDVIYYDSNVYTQAGDYTLRHTAANGCDSIVVLHLSEIRYTEIRHSDTICQGDTLYFHTRPLTATGIYTDTTFSPDRLSDTVWVEDLSVVPYHTVSIESNYTCLDPPHYTLVARTDAPYIRWTSRPDDGILPSEKDTIVVNPDDPTTYYLTADYRPEPLCPSTDSITLVHIEPVLARISAHPDYLTDDLRLLKAQNVSIGTLDEHRWTVWYNENPFTWDTANTILLDVPYTVDSVVLQLTVSNGLCADTASVTVLNLSDAIYLPNVFTPDKPTNNTFYAVGKGILEFEIWIYDRRGDLVYHSTDINEHWNGTHNGLICHQGTYVYRCRYTTTLVPNGWQTLTGTVTILK